MNIDLVPMILVDEKKFDTNVNNNYSDNDISSQQLAQTPGLNLNNTGNNKLSKFIFDFYKTPADDSFFPDDDDNESSNFSYNKKDVVNYGDGIKTKRLIDG